MLWVQVSNLFMVRLEIHPHKDEPILLSFAISESQSVQLEAMGFDQWETPDFQAAPPRLLEWIARLVISIMDSHVVLAASRQLRPSFRSWL